MRHANAIVGATLRQLLGIKRTVFFGIGALLPAAVLLASGNHQTDDSFFESYLGIGVGLFHIVIPIITLILASSALGDERKDKTLSFLAVRPIHRSTIVGSKIMAALLAALIFNIIGAFAISSVYGSQNSDWNFLMPMVLGAVVATAIYTGVFVPLGYITERSTIIGLVFIFIWETASVGALDTLKATSPWRLGYASFIDLAPDQTHIVNSLGEGKEWVIGNLTPSAGTALVQALIVLATATAFLAWRMRNRDLI